MDKVDAQMHVWGGLAPNAETTRPSFVHTDLLPIMDEAEVQRVVLVPPSWAADGNGASLTAATANPARFAVMTRIAVESPATDKQLLAGYARDARVLGIRLAFRREPHATWLTDGTSDWVWPEAEQLGVPIMVYAPGRLPEIAARVRKHPGLSIIADHMGLLPSARGTERDQQLSDLLAMAELPNVGVKLSALPLYSDGEYPLADLHPMIRRIIEAFGPDRSFWGSDFTRLKCTYVQAVDMMSDVLSWLSDDDAGKVMGEALLKWLGWDR